MTAEAEEETRIRLVEGVSDEAVKLLDNVTWGASTDERYGFVNAADLLAERRAQMLVAECTSASSGELLALFTLVPGGVLSREAAASLWYLTNFAVRACARGRGVGKKLLDEGMSLFEARCCRSNAAAVVWLVVDTENAPSLASFRGAPRFQSLGFVHSHCTCFVRPAKKADPRVVRGTAEDAEYVAQRCRALRGTQNVLDLTHSSPLRLRVVRDPASGNRVVAAADVTTISQMSVLGHHPTWGDWALQWLAWLGRSKLPIIFADGSVRVAALSFSFAEPGFEDAFFAITQSIQAEFDASFCAWVYSLEDPVVSRIVAHSATHSHWPSGLLGKAVTSMYPVMEVFAAPFGGASVPSSAGNLVVPFYAW